MPRIRAHYGVTLKNLLDAGYLDVGQELTCNVGGRDHVARLNPDATIQHEGETYRDPSPWVKSLAGGSEMRGWTHVKVRSETLMDFLNRYINVTMKDLLGAGFLNVDQVLDCTVDRQSSQSKLNSDAQIEWRGAQYVLRPPWVEPISGNGTKLGYTDVTTSSGKTLLDLIKEYRKRTQVQNAHANQPFEMESLGAEIGSPSDSHPNRLMQGDPLKELREEVARLSPREFNVLIRHYLEDKGFVGTEITVHLKMTIRRDG